MQFNKQYASLILPLSYMLYVSISCYSHTHHSTFFKLRHCCLISKVKRIQVYVTICIICVAEGEKIS